VAPEYLRNVVSSARQRLGPAQRHADKQMRQPAKFGEPAHLRIGLL
jgi:hypothetical protein